MSYDPTQLIRRPRTNHDEFAPHSERRTETMGEHESALLRIASASGAVWAGEVSIVLDGELAVEVAAAVALYARQREREAKAKRRGLTLGENYTIARLQFFARDILRKLR